MKLNRKLIGLALSVNMLGLGAIPALAVDFSDLRNDYWAYPSIQSLSNQHILSGYSDNTFKPDSSVTRAEFATMIIKALNKENMRINREVNFSDLSRNFWAYESIQKAYELGLIKGFPGNTFKPYAYITKSEILAILSSAAQLGYVSNSEAQEILSRFYDSNRVPDWAVVPAAKAVKAGLAVNYPQPNFLMPEKRVSRAEVAAMLFNLRQNLGFEAPAAQQQQPAYNQQQNPYPQQTSQQAPNVQQISQYLTNGTASNVVLQGSIATIESYSVLPTTIETPISSEIANVGDTVVLKVSNSIATNQGVQLIPAGSRISGKVVSVISAKHANRNAKINIDFNTLTLPNGQSYPLQASIATESGMLEAGTLKSQLVKGLLTTAIGAGSGAALGTALGAITGSTGKGAIYGTAIGGGLGVVGAVLQKGGAIEIPSGEALFIKLNRPLSIDTRSGSVVY